MKELKTELVELINSDYADFINLSTNLNGVDRMMEDLRKPLDRMKNDAIVCILCKGYFLLSLGSILIVRKG
jgi:hypothetical protein